MEQPFLRERLEQADLEVVVPEAADRELVHRVIYDELVLGTIREASRQRYREVVARLVDRGAQGVILGCTEIELLIGDKDAPVPVSPPPACTSTPRSRPPWPTPTTRRHHRWRKFI